MSPKKKFQLALTAIVVLVASGMVGFKLILPSIAWFDSFYFTLITLTTIGYGEPPGMTHGGRVFAAVLIITGVGTIGYALSVAVQARGESELLSAFWKRKNDKGIKKL